MSNPILILLVDDHALFRESQLIDAIRRVATGGTWLDQGIMRSLIEG
jgi:DNA-binding NarL/FixJ family response regulator